MCIDAAAGIQLQCGREYGFSNDAERATVVSELTDSFLEGLPTNNIVAERYLTKFDRLSVVSKFRNKKCKTKGIKNYMTLFKYDFYPINVSKTSTIVELTKLLSERELKRCDDQKIKLKERIKLEISKSPKSKDYVKCLL